MCGVLIASLLYVVGLVVGKHSQAQPVWPSAVTYEFRVTDGIGDFELPVKAYYSSAKKMIRYDTWGGMNKVFVNLADQKVAHYFPIMVNSSSAVGRALYDLDGSTCSPFPTLSGYKFDGNTSFHGVPTSKWVASTEERQLSLWIQTIKTKDGEMEFMAGAESKMLSSYGSETNHLEVLYFSINLGEPNDEVWNQPKFHEDYEDEGQYVDTVEILLGKFYLELPTETAYERNRQLVEKHNRISSGYKLELNRFAHLTTEEMAKYKGLRPRGSEDQEIRSFPYTEDEFEKIAETLPESWDWRIHGAVTRVKDQRWCGSCWAFATIGALESAYFIKTGKLVEFSEQFLMDCGWDQSQVENHGCFGGENGFQFIQENGGVMSDLQYGAYQAENGRCHQNKTELLAPIQGYTRVTSNVNAVKVALVNHGPLMIGINTPHEFMFYSHGVLKSSASERIDHGVILVGYGVLNNESYWLVKNSWGEAWGEDGYVLISTENNTLKVLDDVHYATMAIDDGN